MTNVRETGVRGRIVDQTREKQRNKKTGIAIE